MSPEPQYALEVNYEPVATPDPLRVRRRLPPFGRELAEARRSGMVPDCSGNPLHAFLVCYGWGVHRRFADEAVFPRIVLPLDNPAWWYDLTPLAGLDLLLAYEPRHAYRIYEAVDEIVACGPRSLWVWAVGPAPNADLIQPVIEQYEEMEWLGPRLK